MINIFNPVRVFKDELSASWASNIRASKKGSEKIPINKNCNPPALVLDAVPEVEYFIGVLPVSRDWDTQDLSSLEILKFNVTTTKTEFPDIKVILCSQLNSESEEVDSDPISLSEHGLMEGCEQEFIIPLDEFFGEGFDINNVRTIKFIGCGNFNVSLSSVVIE